MIRNDGPDYVRIATYMFTEACGTRLGMRGTGTMYNRFMLSLDDVLRSGGIDIRLPRCWFIEGEEVVRYGMDDYLYYDHDCPDLATVDYKYDGPDIDPADPVVGAIAEHLDAFIGGCDGRGGCPPPTSVPPYTFQGRFDGLMTALEGICAGGPAMERSDLERMFSETMSSFPANYAFLSGERSEFERVFLTGLRMGRGFGHLLETVYCFWRFVCHHLRIDPACGSNVPKVPLALWEEDLARVHAWYGHAIRVNANYLFPDGCPDPEVDRMLEELRRDVAELRVLVTEMNGGLPS
ncbi:MAG: hypothetical protein IJ469_04995 [Candidatus Methanomethylophilaceae archaeon]|nr:hypothetical protein [Candidatus Methanomethylophilaceae archaeon]